MHRKVARVCEKLMIKLADAIRVNTDDFAVEDSVVYW
jgi:hypothetical protein